MSGKVAESRPKFQFMDFEVWRDAIEIGVKLFALADKLESRGLYRFAEQLRGSGLSMSNNMLKVQEVIRVGNSLVI
jgi:hypothetical protein